MTNNSFFQILEPRRLLSAGDLDFSFSSDGMQIIDIAGAANEVANAVVVQSDGKVVLAGRATVGAGTDFEVVRLLANGSPDPSFGGGDGAVTIDFSVNDEAQDLALDATGKIVVVGTSSSGAGSNARDFAIARLNTNGTLDTSFSGDGKTTVDFGSNDDAMSVAIDNSAIYVGGYKDLGTTGHFALAKLLSNGAPDSTYSTDGEVFFGFGGNNDSRCYDIAIDDQHRVVMGGYDEALGGTGPNRHFAVARVGTDALLDPDFSGDGRAVTDFFGGDDEARAVGIDLKGNIVLGGFAEPAAGGQDFAATRLSSAGALDSTFNGDGRFTLDLGTLDRASDLSISADGTITLSGVTGTGGFQAAVVQIQPTGGTLSTSFGDGGDGIQLVNFGAIDDGFAIALSAEGNIAIAGTDGGGRLAVAEAPRPDLIDPNFNSPAASIYSNVIPLADGNLLVRTGNQVRRLLASGAADPSFTTINPPMVAADMALDGLGRIVLGGNLFDGIENVGAIRRYLANGAPDTAFSGDGAMTFSFTIGNDPSDVNAIAVDASNRVVAVGRVSQGAGGGTADDVAVARVNSGGVLDPTFAGDGINIFPLTTNFDEAFDVAVQHDGRVVLVGNDRLSAFVLRLDTDGSRDLSFGIAGLKDLDLGLGDERAVCVTLDSSQRIVVGGDTGAGVSGEVTQGFVIRLTTDGSLDSSFGGGDGAFLAHLTAGSEFMDGVAVDTDGTIVTLGDVVDISDVDHLVVRRILANGSGPDTTFSGDGVWVVPIEPGPANADFRREFAVDGVIYVGGAPQLLRLNVDPAVVEFEFRFETAPQNLRVQFNDDVGSSLADTDLTILNTTTSSILSPTAYDVASFDAASNTAIVTFAAPVPDGRYRVTFSNSGINNREDMNLAGDRVKEFFFLRGDFNHDGTVNLLDFNILASNFGQSNRTYSQGDANYDGAVNLLDFNVLAGKFGTSVAPGSDVNTASAPFHAGAPIQGRRVIDDVIESA